MVGLLSLSETKELQGEDLVTYLKIRYILCTRRKKNIHNEMSHGGCCMYRSLALKSRMLQPV
jgi:hypothetical protein